MEKNEKIFVAGHRGLVGSALCKKLSHEGYTYTTQTRQQLDLMNTAKVNYFFESYKFDYVFMCAGTVGGIQANSSFPFNFLYENAMIACNVIHAAIKHKTKKLLYLGSSCIYPKMANQPIKESELLTGALEKTNEGYALAKILGVKLCETYSRQYGRNFISVMPTNLYGENDNFDLEDSHVIPGMMRRMHLAKKVEAPEVTLWGTGNAKREFMHVKDAANGIYQIMEKYDNPGETINLGTGVDVTIRELARMMKKVVGYEGKIVFDSTSPDGTPRKLLDSSKAFALGFKPTIDLEAGLAEVYTAVSHDGKLD